MTTPARSDVVKLFVGQIPKTLEEDGVREGASGGHLCEALSTSQHPCASQLCTSVHT